MRTRKEVLEEMERIKDDIEQEKSFHPNNGELSFYYYLLGSLQDELDAIERSEEDD